MTITIIGAGAFGTALAVNYARHGASVALVCRSEEQAAELRQTHANPKLDGVALEESIWITHDLCSIDLEGPVLLSVPAQTLETVLLEHAQQLRGKTLVACCKGIDLRSLKGPIGTINDTVPTAQAAMLTGPSFAADVARDLPTALTLACKSDDRKLQELLSTPSLRLYRTTDTIGAEFGGALKNVVAIGAGIAIGSGLGDSARASLMTRGFSEMQRLAIVLGARPETLTGLSGLGDLALTCTSMLSRNFRYGFDLGSGTAPDTSKTVEGVATSKAVRELAKSHNLDLPVCDVIAGICGNELDVKEAVHRLMSRPLKEEY